MSQSRQLAAIMFTDIVGYTALMGKDEQKAFELLKKNRSVQRPIIEKFNGKWLKEIGDGVLASFSTVSDAVYCAATIQKTCEDHPELNLRIGIHLGEVVFEGADVFGDGVNIAARLEPLAPINGILVSESVHRNLGNKPNIVSSFIREEQLKNVTEPIKIYSVQVEGVEPLVIARTSDTTQQVSIKVRNPRKMAFTVAGVLIILLLSYFLYSTFNTQQALTDAPPEITDKSIAVLPFKDDSEGSDNQYFCDGMMDEILNHLQKIEELGVKSRTAVEPYRNSTMSFASIAQELDVAFVLEGAVRKYGDRFRVTTQLIDVESGNHLWAETYDGIFSDTIFVIQANIAKKIASSLSAVITPDEEERIDRMPTTDIAAYDLFVRARHERNLYWNTLDKKHLKTSHDLLDKAIQIDPEYLRAIVSKGHTFKAEQNYDSAFVYAERVLAVDPEFHQGYGLKGECYSFIGNLGLAIENYLKAIDLSQTGNQSLWYHAALGRAYLAQNQTIMALPYLQKALAMADDLAAVDIIIAGAYFNIGDFEKAEVYSKKVTNSNCAGVLLETELDLIQGKFQEALQFADSTCQLVDCERICSRVLFRASLLLGEFEQAEQYYNQWQSTGSIPFARLINYEIGYVYHKLGRTEQAEEIFTEQINKLESALDRDWIRPWLFPYLGLARIYAFMGIKNKALNYLRKSAKRGFTSGWHDFILIDPFFESLRDDPEFKAIVKKAQEEKAALRAQIREMEERGELTL